MSLTDELAERRAAARDRISPDDLAVMDASTEALLRSDLAREALDVGDVAPDFELPDSTGSAVGLLDVGLVVTVPEELRAVYDRFGIELTVANGDESFELPVPATYVIDCDRTVRFAFVDPDYTVRADPDDILDALRALDARHRDSDAASA